MCDSDLALQETDSVHAQAPAVFQSLETSLRAISERLAAGVPSLGTPSNAPSQVSSTSVPLESPLFTASKSSEPTVEAKFHTLQEQYRAAQEEKKSQVAAITALKAELDGQRQQVMSKDARILHLEKENAELVCAFHSCATCAVWPRHAVLQTEGRDAEMGEGHACDTDLAHLPFVTAQGDRAHKEHAGARVEQ